MGLEEGEREERGRVINWFLSDLELQSTISWFLNTVSSLLCIWTTHDCVFIIYNSITTTFQSYQTWSLLSKATKHDCVFIICNSIITTFQSYQAWLCFYYLQQRHQYFPKLPNMTVFLSSTTVPSLLSKATKQDCGFIYLQQCHH